LIQEGEISRGNIKGDEYIHEKGAYQVNQVAPLKAQTEIYPTMKPVKKKK
jgi:hypothetical protein